MPIFDKSGESPTGAILRRFVNLLIPNPGERVLPKKQNGNPTGETCTHALDGGLVLKASLIIAVENRKITTLSVPYSPPDKEVFL